jgi:hypothetical protein
LLADEVARNQSNPKPTAFEVGIENAEKRAFTKWRKDMDVFMAANPELLDFSVNVWAKKDLTSDSPKSNHDNVKSELEKLIAKVKRLAAKPGAKAGLARVLKVAPARVTEWLTDDKEKRKEPGGYYTLELLKWVEQQELQK